jgi:hypothetical protein
MSEYKLTINRQADNLASALVGSATNLNPIAFPQLVLGTKRPFRVEIVSNGAIDPASGDGDYALTVSIGRRCQYPTDGSFKLGFAAAETASLNYNVSPSDLQSALEGLAGIGAGNVVVQGKPGRVYRIEFIGTLADTNLGPLSVVQNSLTPSSSVFISTFQEGGSGENEVKVIRLRQIPQVVQATWESDATGWTGILSTGSWESLLSLAEESPFAGVMEVTLTDLDGNIEPLAQVDATIICDVAEPSQFVPGDSPNFLTSAQSNLRYFAQSGTITEATPTNDEYVIDFDSGAIYTRLTVDDDVDLTTTGRETGIVKRQYIEIINTDTNDHTLTTEAWLWLGGPPLLIPGPGSLFIEIFSTGAAVGDIRAAAAIGE